MSWQWRMMQNLKRNWFAVPKLIWGIRLILTWALESLKNFHFDALFLSKVCIIWAKKVQRSCLSWNWRVIQNLVRNQLVVSKLTWGIWQILTWALDQLRDHRNIYPSFVGLNPTWDWIEKRWCNIMYHYIWDKVFK